MMKPLQGRYKPLNLLARKVVRIPVKLIINEQ
jgi:hypothetical protein